MSGIDPRSSTAPAESSHAKKDATGPRGGTTTISRRGWIKKNFWLPPELAEQLRDEAFRRRVSEADIFREALQRSLDPGANVDEH